MSVAPTTMASKLASTTAACEVRPPLLGEYAATISPARSSCWSRAGPERGTAGVREVVRGLYVEGDRPLATGADGPRRQISCASSSHVQTCDGCLQVEAG